MTAGPAMLGRLRDALLGGLRADPEVDGGRRTRRLRCGRYGEWRRTWAIRPGGGSATRWPPTWNWSKRAGRRTRGGRTRSEVGGAHFRRQPAEHRVGGRTADRLDRRLPHLPPGDEPAAEQR